MRTRIALLSAALAVGGLGFSVSAQDAAPNIPATPRQQTFNAEQMGHARELLTKVTELAVTKDSVDDLIDWFTEEDQKRFENFELTDEQENTLNGRIEQIQRDYKAKYNRDLSIDADRTFADGSFSLRGPDAADRARMAGDRPDQNRPAGGQDRATIVLTDAKSGAMNRQGDANRDNPNAGDANRQAGGHQVMVPVVFHDGEYLIDVPDSVDGQKLYANLLYALTEVGNNVDSWPADAIEANRVINMKVLAAVTDSLKDKSDQNRSNPNQPRDNANPNNRGGM